MDSKKATTMSKLNRPFQPLELQPYTIHFLEIGYGPDTKWKEKFQKKAEQHAALANILTQTHWKVIIHPIIFGVGGTIFNTTLDTLISLGVPKEKAQKCLNKINNPVVGPVA